MTSTWLPWCTKYPGPAEKQGYESAPARTLAQIEGEVKHSAEGGMGYLLTGTFDDPERRASWTFSVGKDGKVYQHYPLESIPWTSGSLEANVRYVGIEHEGITGEVLDGPQYEATLHLSRDLRALCPLIAASPPARKVNLWEHREAVQVYGGAATACPGGRIPWDRLIADLIGEETDVKVIVARPSGRCFAVGLQGKRYIDDTEELGLYEALFGKAVEATDVQADAIPDAGVSAGRSGTWVTNA